MLLLGIKYSTRDLIRDVKLLLLDGNSSVNFFYFHLYCFFYFQLRFMHLLAWQLQTLHFD